MLISRNLEPRLAKVGLAILILSKSGVAILRWVSRRGFSHAHFRARVSHGAPLSHAVLGLGLAMAPPWRGLAKLGVSQGVDLAGVSQGASPTAGSEFIYVHFIYISISRYGELYDRRKNPAPSAQIPVPEMYMKYDVYELGKISQKSGGGSQFIYVISYTFRFPGTGNYTIV